jgi:lactoylglutathione lyase
MKGAPMTSRLSYIIKFVGDMDRAVRFHRDVLGLPLKFQSPDWSEFATGDATLALHSASPANPAGKIQLGFRVDDLQAWYAEMTAEGIVFTQPPVLEIDTPVARFLDSDGVESSVSGK